MQLHFKIIGYYEHCNFGDDQYKKSFSKLFADYIYSDYTIDFYNCDKVHEYSFADSDIIIIGGGDILNPYFLNKINKRFKLAPNLIIAFSVGLPYTKTLVETNLLNIIDYIFLRTVQDLDIFKTYFDKDRIFYIPDLSYVLSNDYLQNTIQNSVVKDSVVVNDVSAFSLKIQGIKKSHRVICICLSRHIYNKNYEKEYNTVISNLCEFIVSAIDQNYHVVLLPFNTNSDNPNENDILINNDVINNISSKSNHVNHITNIDVLLNETELQNILKYADISICMRFHSILFSIYNNIPFIPIYTTRKIHNLLLDIGWEYSYELPTNEKFIPIDLDKTRLENLLTKLNTKLYKNIYHELLHINTNCFGKMFFKNIQKF